MDWTTTILLALGTTGLGGFVLLFISWLRGRETIAKRTGADAQRATTEKQRQGISRAIAQKDREAHRTAQNKIAEVQKKAKERQEEIRRRLAEQIAKPTDDEELNNLIKLSRARRDPGSES